MGDLKARSKVESGSEKQRRPSRGRRRGRSRYTCPYCQREVRFCWTCRCGFLMCQECMNENLWGMTCNNIWWECPDCGRTNSYGNQ